MGNVAFLITGEVLTNTARNMVLSEEPGKAWALIVDSLVGKGADAVAKDLLEGRVDLIGDSRDGIRVADATNVSKYLADLDFIYGGRLKTKYGWCRPCAQITVWSSESGRAAVRRLNSGELLNDDLAPGGSMRAWAKARAEHLCERHEFAERVEIDGERVYVIFESCGEPPFWRARNNTAQEAVEDARRVGRSLEKRGREFTSIREATTEMIDFQELDEDGLRAQELRELAEEARNEVYQEQLRQIGKDVRAQAGDDTFDLTLLDGRVVTVPRAPFVCWALSRVKPELAPSWKPVCGSGHKMENDDPRHTEWVLGAQLTLSEAYQPNVNRPAWDEVGRIQARLMGSDEIEQDTENEEQVYPGIFAALNSLRKSTVRATVIVNGGQVSGVVGEDICVLPDLSPLRVPELKNAKAVIAEEGGPLSHLAIVSQEKGLTVMRVANARQIFKTGMQVSICPKSGRITIDGTDD